MCVCVNKQQRRGQLHIRGHLCVCMSGVGVGVYSAGMAQGGRLSDVTRSGAGTCEDAAAVLATTAAAQDCTAAHGSCQLAPNLFLTAAAGVSTAAPPLTCA